MVLKKHLILLLIDCIKLSLRSIHDLEYELTDKCLQKRYIFIRRKSCMYYSTIVVTVLVVSDIEISLEEFRWNSGPAVLLISQIYILSKEKRASDEH